MNVDELTRNLPIGHLKRHLDKTYTDGLLNYQKYVNSNEEEFDIYSVVNEEFDELLLKNDFIKDLQLFPSETLLKILESKENEIESLDPSLIRQRLLEYYSISNKKERIENQFLETEVICELPLHDFQERMRRRVINMMFNNQRRFLIQMPTGAGKTRTATEIVIDFIRFSSAQALFSENLKILWVAQTSELCEQAYQTFISMYRRKGTSDIQIGNYYGNFDISSLDLDKPAIIFCGIQKLLNNYKNQEWQQIKENNYLVIIDEAHRSVAKEWRNALDFFVDNGSTYLLGLTATPGTGTKKDISNTFNISTYFSNSKISITDEKYQDIDRPITYLTEKGFLAKIKNIIIKSNNDHLDIGKFDDGVFKYPTKTLEDLSVNPLRNNSIVNIVREHIDKNEKILIFTCGVSHNKILKKILRIYGIDSEYVDSSTKNRNLIIDRFKEGDLGVLLNYGVLTTGFDAPKTNVEIIARPVESIVMYSQMVGRILRGPRNNGNSENTLYTIKDNFNHKDYDELYNSFNHFYN